MGRPEGDRASEDGDEPRVDRSPRGNWIETVAAVVSTLLVTFVVGFIVYEAITSPADGVPHLVVTVERVERQEGGHHVAFRAINSGSAAAAAVRVEGRLSAGAETVEVSSVTLDYVPSQSQHRGALLFQHDPANLDLKVVVTGYQEP